MKLGEAMYKAEQAQAAAADDAAGDGAAADDATAAGHDRDENVVDADFEEVDDDKKGQSSAP